MFYFCPQIDLECYLHVLIWLDCENYIDISTHCNWQQPWHMKKEA